MVSGQTAAGDTPERSGKIPLGDAQDGSCPAQGSSERGQGDGQQVRCPEKDPAFASTGGEVNQPTRQ